MDWERLIKRYVWDDQKTPYFVPVNRLSRYQADHELLAFNGFVILVSASIALLSLNASLPFGQSYAVSAFCASIALGAIVFGLTKHVAAACFLVLAPLGSLGYLLFQGFPVGMPSIDKIFLIVIALVLLRYMLRVIAIAKAYPGLREPVEDR